MELEENKDIYKTSRFLYILEAAFEYFISLLVTGAYLAKITKVPITKAKINAYKKEHINNNDKFANNKFVSTFIKYKGFDCLTRDMAINLIDRVNIYEGKRIELEMKFKDEFESALKYVEDNLQ